VLVPLENRICLLACGFVVASGGSAVFVDQPVQYGYSGGAAGQETGWTVSATATGAPSVAARFPVRGPCEFPGIPRVHGRMTDGGVPVPRLAACMCWSAGCDSGRRRAVCKTVGSAYVGSNPTPATRFRRSEPVTLDCVTGFWRERERFIRPSAVVRGLCVGQIRLSAAAAHGAG
jgi:hypothetical protein